MFNRFSDLIGRSYKRSNDLPLQSIDPEQLMWYSLPAIYFAIQSSGLMAPHFIDKLENKSKDLFSNLKFKPVYCRPMQLLGRFVTVASLQLHHPLKDKDNLLSIFKSKIDDKDKLMLQIQLRLVFISALFPKSWIAMLIFRPGNWSEYFLPGSQSHVSMGEHLTWFSFFAFDLLPLFSVFILLS